MSPRVLVVEFRPLPGNISGELTAFVTQEKYSHTGIVIDDCYYEMDGRFTNAYCRYKFYSIDDLRRTRSKKTGDYELEFYTLPSEPDDFQVSLIKHWWEEKITGTKPYFGWGLFFGFLFSIPLKKFYYWYRIKTGIKLKNIARYFQNNYDVCSVAVADSLKFGQYDIFPDEDPSMNYPGKFANKLDRYA